MVPAKDIEDPIGSMEDNWVHLGWGCGEKTVYGQNQAMSGDILWPYYEEQWTRAFSNNGGKGFREEAIDIRGGKCHTD